MPFVAGPEGPIEVVVTGEGQPTTVFAHGFASSIEETRPFGSGVEGSRVFFHFRGHGDSARPDSPWSYLALEGELRSVATEYAARRGVGISLGAGALVAAALSMPDWFGRLVLVLPAALDAPRTGRAVESVEAMASSADAGDTEALTRLLLAEQAPLVRDRRVVQMWARQQATRLATDPLVDAIRTIPQLYPIDDRARLATLACPVLVIGQEGDEAHPAEVARDLAAALPQGRLEMFRPGGLLWTHRAQLRPLISSFLNE